MAVHFAVLLLLASPTTFPFAQSANERFRQDLSWRWPYKQVYPPPSVNEVAGGPRSLYFALMMSFGGEYESSGAIPGVQAALDEINSDPALLPGYKLHYTLTDSQCNRTVALDAFFKQIVQYPVKIGWIGSGCSVATEPTAEISHHYNITQLSCVSSSTELANHERFRYYFQLLATDAGLAPGFFSIIKQFGWRNVAIIEQNENLFTVTMTRLKVLLMNASINFTESIFNTEDSIEGGLGPQLFDPQSRIFIIASYPVHARRVLCKAFQAGLHYPRYMFITYGWYADGWWEVEEEEEGPEDGCTPKQRESVLSYTLAPLQFEFLDDYSTITDTGINGTQYADAYKTHQNSQTLPDVEKNRTNVYGQTCYDATWTLAFSLNKTITELESNSTLNADVCETGGIHGNATFPLEHFSYNNSALLDVIFRHVQNTNFNGITGNVSFGPNRIREVDRLQVYQYRYKDGVLKRMMIGSVNESYQFVYVPGEEEESWPGGLIPHDGVPLEVKVAVALPLTVIFSILAAAGIVFAVVCLVFNCIFRNKKLIRLSSPNLNYLIGGGAIILYIDIYFFIIPTTDPKIVGVLCHVTPWLTALGYSLCYGTILAKMARVYYIFDNPTLKKKYDWHLAIGVLLLVLIDLVILIIYNIAEGIQRDLTATQTSNRENPMDVNGVLSVTTVYFTYICGSRGRDIFLGFLYGYKMVLQIIALVLAFSIRKVKVKGLNDAKYIAAAIYVTSIVLTVIIISTYSLKEFVNGFAALFCTGFVIGTTFILGLIFMPKMISLYRDPQGKTIFPPIVPLANPNSPVLPSPSNGHSKDSVDAEAVRSLRNRIAELETILSQDSQTETHSSLLTKGNETQNTLCNPDRGINLDKTQDSIYAANNTYNSAARPCLNS